ncbi:MAG: peptidoglycan synthetase [Bacteroidales bacterium]|nr:peptidoglycan synthetase [Bacteroidales bacterium]
MKIHLIAIGGAVMHNLALALHNKGIRITGSDDEIYEPSRSRLEEYGLLPEKKGWDPARITPELDGVILGMHAKKNNPELLRAQELGIKIWSFPEYIFEQSKEKKRVVIAGSHGKTTVTSMVMHVLWYNHCSFDYMVGSQLEGFDTMVKLTEDAPVVILEGDEYLSSPVDPRPKFHLYHPHVAVITGIAWDHMNVFPSIEDYVRQFEIFARSIPENGKLFWYENDQHLKAITGNIKCRLFSYQAHEYSIEQGKTFLSGQEQKIPVSVFGNHNMQNISAALMVCRELGLDDELFYEAIPSFRGASKRQQLMAASETKKVFFDFAHAPSKVKATLESFRETFPNEQITAILELHTFSSLNKDFLPQYEGTMNAADRGFVFFNPEVLKHKKFPPLELEFVKACFHDEKLEVINDQKELLNSINGFTEGGIYLFMSSGNFSGLDIKLIAESITGT